MADKLKYPAPAIRMLDTISDGTAFVLTEDYRVQISPQIAISIPKGYRSDGASVPRFFWRLLSPKIDMATLGPSIVHDWMYGRRWGSRADADAWYRDALIANKYPRWKARLTYTGLRWFGGSHW